MQRVMFARTLHAAAIVLFPSSDLAPADSLPRHSQQIVIRLTYEWEFMRACLTLN